MSSTQQLLLGEGAGGGAAPAYIEEVFSTYLYGGNDNGQGITNGIDLSTKGGMVWIKSRTGTSGPYNALFDTNRGAGNVISSNSTDQNNAFGSASTLLSAFTTSGFTLGTDSYQWVNRSPQNYASWSFRKQPKFFDVVTYTGTGSARTVTHNLGSVPGCMIVKCTSNATENWVVYHRSLGATKFILLNSTAAEGTQSTRWNNTTPTSTEFTVGSAASTNASGQSYVAYLFAHDAGGFGLTGSDNVVSCGSFTTGASGNISPINLGYEPQWVLLKPVSGTSGSGDWQVFDTMRLFTAVGNYRPLNPNKADLESGVVNNTAFVTSTGFYMDNISGNTTYIYVVIRRGPMKIPTDATKVYKPVATTANGSTVISTSFPVDLSIIKARANTYNWWWSDRLRGNQSSAYTGTSRFLFSNTTDSEQVYTSTTPGVMMAFNEGIIDYAVLPSGYTGIYYNFRRAPGFFDEVCYTGTGSLTTITHNLAAVPELMIVKRRNTVEDWNVYNATIGNTAYLRLNTSAASATAGGDALWGSTTPTSSVFTVKTSGGTNASGGTYVAYLFASCPGVSKVGSYVGNGVDTTIDCGFVDGARLVLIKSTSYAENWAIFDSARGYATASDPYLALDSSSPESLGNWLLFRSEGFGVRSSSFPGGSLNVSGQSYIFLAIA